MTTYKQPADEVAAHELALYAVNEGPLYTCRAKPIMLNLAAKILKGTYDATPALKLWRYLADDAARTYTRQHGNGRGFGIFTPASRDLAAREIAEHYEEELRDTARMMQREWKEKKASR